MVGSGNSEGSAIFAVHQMLNPWTKLLQLAEMHALHPPATHDPACNEALERAFGALAQGSQV